MSRALYALKCFFLLCLCARNFCRLTMLSAYDALLSCTPAILKRDKISKSLQFGTVVRHCKAQHPRHGSSTFTRWR